MFATLTQRLSTVFDKLRRKSILTESDILESMREIRIALLEADVALPVVKELVEAIKQKALGQEIIKSQSISVSAEQMIIKLVHDELIQMLHDERSALNLAGVSPIVYLMAGLQGSGKTTSSAKLAKHLKESYKKKVLLVSTDIYRPAAQDQLETLAKSLSIDSLEIIKDQPPLDITKRALEHAKRFGYDVVILDTAGRLHIDEELMSEVKNIAALSNPLETFLVADAMTGQDAVTVAKAFTESLPLTGLILTRVDGDARGGAALSMKSMTGCPIKFLGVGEKTDQLEIFSANRIADRILDRGDIVALVEKAASTMNQEQSLKAAERLQKGLFNLDDFSMQLQGMLNMGGISSLMTMLPGMGSLKDKVSQAGMDDKMVKRQLAILSSMTPKERKTPDLLNASRRRRIAKGCGLSVNDINKLMKQYDQIKDVMKKMKKLGGKGLMRSGLKNLFGR